MTVHWRQKFYVTDLSRKALYEIAHNAADKDSLVKRSNGYLERHRMATERVLALEETQRQRNGRTRILETFICNIASSPQVLTEFDERLWEMTIDRLAVMPDDRFVFRFRDGTKLKG